MQKNFFLQKNKNIKKKKKKIQTCWDFLSSSSDNEQSYQSVPSICVNSFTWTEGSSFTACWQEATYKDTVLTWEKETPAFDGTSKQNQNQSMGSIKLAAAVLCTPFQSYLCNVNTAIMWLWRVQTSVLRHCHCSIISQFYPLLIQYHHSCLNTFEKKTAHVVNMYLSSTPFQLRK